MIVHTSPIRGGWRRLKIERHLDHAAAPAVLDEIIRAAKGGCPNLLIDLDSVDSADDHGIAALAAAIGRVRRVRANTRIAVLAHSAELADAVARALPEPGVEICRDPSAVGRATIEVSAA
jgi:anti-anti-sigma regulatory factor